MTAGGQTQPGCTACEAGKYVAIGKHTDAGTAAEADKFNVAANT
jgi:hypothetical protein